MYMHLHTCKRVISAGVAMNVHAYVRTYVHSSLSCAVQCSLMYSMRVAWLWQTPLQQNAHVMKQSLYRLGPQATGSLSFAGTIDQIRTLLQVILYDDTAESSDEEDLCWTHWTCLLLDTLFPKPTVDRTCLSPESRSELESYGLLDRPEITPRESTTSCLTYT